ncbi:MAG: efflux RND transporter periplasmic adaptor subunit [bacterium]|nr:efflux RND transporter periplasmic adaptor subunit [bacterium]
MKRLLATLLPILLIVVAVLIAGAMINARPAPDTRIPDIPLPMVRVQAVELQDLQLTVKSQGTVRPRTESMLVPEVSGRVIEVSPSFESGGFFEEGDLLLRIDPHDYRQAAVQSHSAVAAAELRLAEIRAEAEIARKEWDDLGSGEATPLTLFEPQLLQAEAALASAEAARGRAERDLERTAVRAPYAGRVRTKEVDLGQFVGRGARLGTIYAIDFAEIRLPLPDHELAFVRLPLGYRGEGETPAQPEVVLTAEFAGRVHTWHGRIVRTAGEIDPQSRMVRAVARVENPYARGADRERPPLAAGMFVEAEIVGRSVENVSVIPRSALRSGDQVLILDDENRLRFRDVTVLRLTPERAILSDGLATGDRVCLSAISAVTDGMRVRPHGSIDGGES